MQSLKNFPIDNLIEYARNPRNNDHAVDEIAAAIREFGFRVPIVAKSDGTVVDGHLRLKAARKLGLKNVPVLLADDLTEIQIKAFRLSVNKMAEKATWDNELLKLEIEELQADEFNLGLIGFSADELNVMFNGWQSDVETVEKAGENLDGIAKNIRIMVDADQEAMAREAITNALDAAGVTYDLK